jgi:predicted RND superfamily exporter protein
MWNRIASIVLRQRNALLAILGALTVFLGWHIPDIRLQYTFGGLLPADHPTYIAHERFLNQFGGEGSVLVIGTESAKLTTPEGFQAWYELAESIRAFDADQAEEGLIDSVFSLTHAFRLEKDTVERKFRLVPVLPAGSLEVGGKPSEAFVDSARRAIRDLPFYRGLLWTEDSDATLMMVFLDAEKFNSEQRGTVVEDVTALVDAWSAEHGIEVHLSGLPFIRTEMTNKVKGEVGWFIGAALVVTLVLLFLFFRNLAVMSVSFAVVVIGVVWSLGMMGLFDFPVTLLTSLIPALMIVIGVPNCIYLVNKYHAEYRKHGNKAMALQRMIVKVGNATLLTNFTTAFGFATFIFTESDVLKHFGIVASVNVMAVFVISIVVIPSLMIWLPAPQARHTRHLDRPWVYAAIQRLVRVVQFHRPAVYVVAAAVLGLSVWGITRMQTTGNIVDDLPEDDRVIQDLQWVEHRFHGVMPFEVLIDTGTPEGASSLGMLKKVEQVQDVLAEYPEFSRSLSAVDATKFAVQTFYNGSPERYRLPSSQDRRFIGPWLRGPVDGRSEQVVGGFFDSTKAVTRISAQMADIGTRDMDVLMADLRPRLDSILPPEEYTVTLTGTSVVFLEGTRYLVDNLRVSIALALVVIAGLMAFLFRSARMVVSSLLPNVLPLCVTAGLMGWLGIPLKPSTVLVFSIALGISVDDTIHFLAKYRQELKIHRWNIRKAVLLALMETGHSMVYTSVVLFFGFLMFALSEFDGTQSLGLLVSITLGVAMFSNLILLPSLLLSFGRRMTTQVFAEPFIDLLDEEDDIELRELQIQSGLAPGRGEEQHEALRQRRASAARDEEDSSEGEVRL